MIVQLFTRQTYGHQLIYPANPAAKVFAELARTKTFNGAQIELMRDLGATIEQVPDPQGSIACILTQVRVYLTRRDNQPHRRG